jgi:hypothetical protein
VIILFSASAGRGNLSAGLRSEQARRAGGTQAVPLPTHIKIDVDGIEAKVVAGATETLKKSGVRSLLIETNTNLQAHRSMIHALTDLGFRYDPE